MPSEQIAPARKPATGITQWRDALLLAGVLLAMGGLAVAEIPWRTLVPGAVDFVALATFAIALGFLARLAFRVGWAKALAIPIVLVLAVRYAGAESLLATGLLAAAGLACGTLLPGHAGVTPIVRMVAGLGIVAGLAGWFLPYPLHSGTTWMAALLALVWWRRVPILEQLRALHGQFASEAATAPAAAMAWSVVFVLASAPAWLPIVHSDDLAYHMSLGNELAQYGHARFDVGAQSFALSPWASDLLHGLVFLMSGRDHIGPLNVLWLALAGLGIQAFSRRIGLDAATAWLVSMLYLSLPLTSFLVSSMQTEQATTAVLVALALCLVDGSGEQRANRVYIVAALAGFALALKISNGLLLLPFFVWWVWAWRGRLPWRLLPQAVVIGVVVTGSSYAFAWSLSGNPVLPMLNGWFQVPWFPPINFVDATWQSGFGPAMMWRLFFETQRYFEGHAGAAGIALVVLGGGLLGALARPELRFPAVVALAALLLPLSQVQYLRYAHPAMAVLLPVLAAGLMGRQAGWRPWLLLPVIGIQLLLVPTSSWVLSTGALRTLALQGADAVMDRYVPERKLSRRFQQLALASDRILYLDPVRSHHGEVPGTGMGTAWFAPFLASANRQMDSAALDRLVHRAGVNHVMAYDLATWPGAQSWLGERGALKVDGNGAATLFWLPPRERLTQADTAAGIAMSAQLDAPFPQLVQAGANLSCDIPGEPVAIAWTVSSSAPGTMGHWDWATCGPDGQVVSAIEVSLAAGAGSINLTAAPALPESVMRIEVRADALEARRDFQGETALRDWYWKNLCIRCKGPVSGLEPIHNGPFHDHLVRGSHADDRS
jgi:hypothetical protein